MSDPIDLDLVELRCRLREWKCERTFLYPDDDGPPWGCALEIATPDGHMYVRDDGEYGGDNITSERHEHIITAPRWTLERLLSEPPEGWEYEARHERLMWQGDDGDSLCLSVSWCHDVDGWLEWDFNLATERHHHDLAAFAGQLKAAADLALILAEVEP